MADNGALILVVSNASDVTADFLQARLEQAGVAYRRLNTEDLAELPLEMRIERGNDATAISQSLAHLNVADISAIYYRRPLSPVVRGDLPEPIKAWIANEVRRAWGGSLYADPRIKWVNHPLAISAAAYKPEQLARASRVGLRVPSTLLTTDPESAEAFCDRHEWRVIAKPVGHGEILSKDADDDQLVYTNLVRPELRTSLYQVSRCPTLFQRQIEKRVDLRVTVVGREVIAVELHSQDAEFSRIDCRRENMRGMRYRLVRLSDSLCRQLVELVASYGLRFAAIDLVEDQTNDYWFLEINPAGQWAWLDECAGSNIAGALVRELTSE